MGNDRAKVRDPSDSGAALLVVTGVTAALAMLAALMLAAALASYEARSYRADLVQARALADAVVHQVVVALSNGQLPRPTVSRPVRVRNGVLEASGAAVPVAAFPTPAWGGWPPAVGSASLPGAAVLGLGASATLSRVVGPEGEPRAHGEPPGELIDVDVAAWFRRASVQHRARLAVTGQAARRLD